MMRFAMDIKKEAHLREGLVSYKESGQTPCTGNNIIRLRPGLIVNMKYVPPGTEEISSFEISESPIVFGFMVTGANTCRYDEGELQGQQVTHQAGCNGITCLPETAGSMECDGKNGMARLSVLVSPAFLDGYIETATKWLPDALKAVLQGQRRTFRWDGKISQAKNCFASQMMQCDPASPVAKLFLESKTLELIAWQLTAYLDRSPMMPSHNKLSAGDIKKIKDACHILIQDLANPPGLQQLARLAGVNEKKLKYGFKQVFGMPVFEYFRHYRLETAHSLLVSNAMSISEAASHIGYQNMSHFSAAFKKKYGEAPSSYLRLHRKK